MSSFTLSTPHGLISITDTALKNDNPALLLLHGNSSSSKIWRHVLESPSITEKHRVVAFDLPGHGASSNAPDSQTTYCMRGYAELALYILQHLNISRVVVVGWSLGGHIGIEMLSLVSSLSSSSSSSFSSSSAPASPSLTCSPSESISSDSQPPTDIKIDGLMIIGTPPALGKDEIARGFKIQDAHFGIAARLDWTEEEAGAFARESAPGGREDLFEQWMEDDAKRTDGRSRMMMWSKFAAEPESGNGADQRKVVESTDVLVAVVNGAEEPYVDLEYLEGIKWRRLWRGQCVRLEGAGHAPFWERPGVFEGLLGEFLRDCEGGKGE